VNKWIKSRISQDRRWVYFEVEYSEENVTTKWVGDLYIVKARDYLQQLALNILNLLAYQHMEENEGFFATCSGGDTVDGPGRIRDIDSYLWFNQAVVAIFEADCRCRSLPSAHAYCLEHFAITPSLRAVLLLKIFARGRDHRRIAMVAAVYLRGAAGPAVTDAVAFGTRSLDAADAVPRDIARVLRRLPPARSGPPGGQRRPWTPAQRPYVTVPAAALFGRRARRVPAWRPIPVPGPCPPSRAGSADAPTDFVVDLWLILKQVDTFASGDRFGDSE
jgi:hypothetical protein